MTMPIENIPDWERRLARQDAFWAREVIDRPVVTFTLRRPNPEYPWPASKKWPALRDRWMDTPYMVESAVAGVMNTEYLGDALPSAWPNLGPEVFSAFFGCELVYGATTSYAVPILNDWADAGNLRFSQDNFYWRKILEMTDALLAAGKGKFYTGITDLHPGSDAIAAFRDPQQLNMDLIDAPQQVKALLDRVTDIYFRIFDFYYDKLRAADQAICTWAGIVSTNKWYVPSNDFSCMISKRMFDDVFLPGIIRECRHMQASIYHLDGPAALRHLDSLLDIPELNAISYVYGAGHGRASDWMHVYRKCQAAGKGLQIGVGLDELDFFMENLRPQGLWLSLGGVRDREQADAVLKRLTHWK
jgi:hypothetical protein